MAAGAGLGTYRQIIEPGHVVLFVVRFDIGGSIEGRGCMRPEPGVLRDAVTGFAADAVNADPHGMLVERDFAPVLAEDCCRDGMTSQAAGVFMGRDDSS